MEAQQVAHLQMSPAKSQQPAGPLQQDVVQAGTDQGFQNSNLSCGEIPSSVDETPYVPLDSNSNSSSRSEDSDTPDSPGAAQQQGHAQQSPPGASNSATPPRRVSLEWVEAAKAGDCMELRRLLRAWPSLLNHQVGGLQCTAAHWAAANGHADALQQLLEWGADVMVETATGCLPLHSAAAAGRAECAQQLLLMGDPALLQQQLTAVNEDGLTAAALALRHGHKLVQGFLSQAAAAAVQAPEPASGSAQHHTQQQQEQPVKQAGMRRGFLLGGPARPSGETSNTNTPTNSHSSSPAADFTAPLSATCAAAADGGCDGTTHQHGPCVSTVDNPLFGVACSPVKQQQQGPCQHPAAAAAAAAAPPQAPSRLGAAALTAGASEKTSPWAAATATAAAATSEASVQEQHDSPAAAQEGAADPTPHMVQEQGADVLQQSSPAAAGTAEVPAALKPAPAAAAVDRVVGRAWLDAARAGELPRLQELLQQVPLLLDYRGTGTSYAFVGNSALHWAAAKGHSRCVRWLLQQGAAVGAVNEAGASPLHTAVEHGQPGCAQLLVLLGGGDVGAQDGYGQTVLSLARSTGVRGEQQLMLWEEVRKLEQHDRSAWSNGMMQRFLQLAGKSSEAARCLEKHELLALAAGELQAILDSVAAS